MGAGLGGVSIWTSYVDLTQHRIPNLSLLPLLCLILFYLAFSPHPAVSFVVTPLCLSMILGVMLALFHSAGLKKALGAGDIKLMMVLALLVTPPALPLFLILTGALGIGTAALSPRMQQGFPLAPALFCGYWFSFLLQTVTTKEISFLIF